MLEMVKGKHARQVGVVNLLCWTLVFYSCDSGSLRVHSPATGDPVENYLRQTAATHDPYMTVNALIFRPDDPRLKYEPAPMPAAGSQYVFAKLGPLASFADPSRGPVPGKQTDEVEARMLTDQSMVGSGRFNYGQTSVGETLLVFLDDCRRTMADVQQVYGSPVATVASGESKLHFYGRMICVEVANGKIHAVLRRKI